MCAGVLGISQVRPDAFIEESNPNNSNFETYSQKGGQSRRASLANLRKYFGADVVYGSTPELTGNAENMRNKFLIVLPDSIVWFVDFNGDAARLGAGTGADGGANVYEATELSDTLSIVSPNEGDVLYITDTIAFRGESAWLVFVGGSGGGGGTTTLNDLSDVVISSVANGQVLKYNGSSWVNGTDLTSDPDTLTWNSGSNTLSISGGNSVNLASLKDTVNLTYSGTSSPVTLNSSNGSDVSFTAGPGVGIAATGTNLTITNTGDTDNTDDVTGSGTSGYLPKFTGTRTVGNSSIQDDGTRVILGSPIRFANWITGGRPGSPATGDHGFNTTLGYNETYNGSAWLQSSLPAGTVNKMVYHNGTSWLASGTMFSDGSNLAFGSATFLSPITFTRATLSSNTMVTYLLSGTEQAYHLWSAGSTSSFSIGKNSSGYFVALENGSNNTGYSYDRDKNAFMINNVFPSNSGTLNVKYRSPDSGTNTNTAWFEGSTTSDVMVLTNAGLLSIGNSSPAASLHVTGEGTSTGATALFEGSTGTDNFIIRDNGTVDIVNGAYIRQNGGAGGLRITGNDWAFYNQSASEVARFTTGNTSEAILKIAASTTAKPSLNLAAGTSPTTPVAGDVWHDSTEKSFKVSTGVVATLIGTIARGYATATNSNQSTETSITPAVYGTLTLPANCLVPGKTLRVKFGGNYTTDLVSGPDLNIKVKLNSTIVAEMGASELVTTDQGVYSGEFTVQTYTAGATGTVFGAGVVNMNYGTSGDKQVWISGATSTVTVDTTVSQTLSLVSQWSVADTDNSITVRYFYVEVL